MLYLLDERFVAVEACGGNVSVDGLTVVAVVFGGDVGCDEFALAGGEGVGCVEKDFYEIVERPCGFWAEGHCAADAGEAFGELDVCHETWSFQDVICCGNGFA